MKYLIIGFCVFLSGLSWYSCKKSEPATLGAIPNGGKVTNNSLDTVHQGLTGNLAVDSVNLIGTWKWVAQFDLGNPQGDLQNPANSGIQETIVVDAANNWTQSQNGILLNSGNWKFAMLMPPSGWPIPFLVLKNKQQPNAQTNDDFNFATGFGGSFHLTRDTLIFYGVSNNNGQSASTASERIYTK